MIYKCPVCNKTLERKDNTYICENNHSYDTAKKGYVNLLLANQGNHFIEEGDNKESIASRTSFLNAGYYSFLRDKLIEILQKYKHDYFVDLACGEGYYTTGIHKALNSNTYGVDISKSGINQCCTRMRMEGLQNIHFCVGNLDYLPYMDNAFDIALNCFAPIKEKEFVRVLKKDGHFLRVLPGRDHLLEMKNVLYEDTRLNEGKEESIDGFVLEDKVIIKNTAKLDNSQIKNLFSMTPYAFKTPKSSIEKLFKLEELDITFEFVIYVYRKD